MSRIEKILESKILGVPYTQQPLSRLEYLLMNLSFGGDITILYPEFEVGANGDLYYSVAAGGEE